MRTRARIRLAGAAARIGLALLASASGASAAEQAAALKVCLSTANLPYSSRADSAGFDVTVAKGISAHIGRVFETVWYETDDRIQEIDDGDLPTARLARGECDAIFSFPGPAQDTLQGRNDLRLGHAYYGAAFELVTCGAELAPQFRALRGHTVAVQSQTIAHFALLMVKAEPRNYFSLASALSGVAGGETEAGLLWGPAAGYRLRQAALSATGDYASANGCRFVDGYEPPVAIRWNLHAATRAADTGLRERIDQALVAMAVAGDLEKAAEAWGMPWHPPFVRTYSLGAVNELQHVR